MLLVNNAQFPMVIFSKKARATEYVLLAIKAVKEAQHTFNWPEAKEKLKRGETVIDRFGVSWRDVDSICYRAVGETWTQKYSNDYGVDHILYRGWS